VRREGDRRKKTEGRRRAGGLERQRDRGLEG